MMAAGASVFGGCGLAVASGLLGAAAAAAAKLALGSSWTADGGWLPVLLRFGCASMVLVCNAMMWTVFAKALRLSSSSAAASVTTTASNFICSAILGKVLFGETWTFLWWVGLTVTLCGLVLLHTAALRSVQIPAEKDA